MQFTSNFYISSLGALVLPALLMYSMVFWLCFYVFIDDGGHHTSIQFRKLTGYIIPFILSSLIWPIYLLFNPLINSPLFGMFLLVVFMSNMLYYPFSRFSHTLSSQDIKRFDNNFVLYLRSFNVDQDTKIEKFVNSAIESLLPMVAVGIPRKIFHKFVAYRLYLTNKEWEKNVEILARKAALIIMRPNASAGCELEISMCSKYIPLRKVLYLISSFEELTALKSHPSMKDYVVAITKIEQIFTPNKVLLIRFTSKENVEEFCISSFDKICQNNLQRYLQSFLIISNKKERILDKVIHGITAFVFPIAYVNLYRWSLFARTIVNLFIIVLTGCILSHIKIMLCLYVLVALIISIFASHISTNKRKYLTTSHFNIALCYPWFIAIYFVVITYVMNMWVSHFGVHYNISFQAPNWMLFIEFLAIVLICITIKKHYDVFKALLRSDI